MQIFSIMLACSVFIFLLIRRRIFEPEGIFFIGTAFYSFPLYYGYTQFVSSYSPLILYNSEISLFQYGIYNFNIILCGIIAYFPRVPCQFFYQRVENYLKSVFRIFFFKENNIRSNLLFFIEKNMYTGFVSLNLVFLLLVVFYYQAYNYVGGNKLLFSKNLTSFYSWGSLTTTYCFVYFIYKQKTKMDYIKIIPPILFLTIDLLMGYRATTVLSLLSIFMILSLTNKNIYKLKFLLFFSFIGSSMFVFKYVYFRGELSKFFSSNIIVGSEPFSISGAFEKTLENITIVRAWAQNDGYFTDSFLQLLPFYETFSGLERVSFNKYIQLLFPETIWGLASNPYIELIGVGGLSFVFIYLSVVLIIIILYKNLKNEHIKSAFCIFFPYILFYGYRNDFLYPLYVIKNLIIVNFLCCAVLISLFYFLKPINLFVRNKIYE